MKIILPVIFAFFFFEVGWSQPSIDNKKTVKVLSFNILHGATAKGDFDLEVIANVIRRTRPDLVALQEVDFRTNRVKKLDLAIELGVRTKMVPLFARAMPYDGGEYGQGILSKWTFLETRNVPLPHSKGNEPRNAVEITTIINSGDTISFVGTHLDHLNNNGDRIAQAKKINKVFSSNKYPTILAGDLNDVPGSSTINILEGMWAASYVKENPQPTAPSSKPEKKIDYVMFYPKDRWKVLNAKVLQDTIASDHCAYLVTLELLDK